MVAFGQLRALGYSKQAIKVRARAGRLLRIHRGVYAVGHTRLSPGGRRMAAVLACGPGAVLSHRAAAGVHGLYRHSGLIDVTTTSRHKIPGIRCHSVRQALHPDDMTVIDGIPVTSIPRLCLDVAETLAPRYLETILENVQRRDLFDLYSFDALIARSPGRHGIKPLTEALAQLRDDPPWTQSELEDAFVDLTRRAGLPAPLLNQFVDGILVDAFWPEHRLVVEVDGRTFHKTKRAVENDQQRDVKLQIAGYRVVRFSYDRIMNHPHEVARDLRALLSVSGRPASAGVASGR